MGKLIDLTGQRFGRLTVIERSDDYIVPSGQHKPRWLCKCDCGNEVVVWGMSLRNEGTRSCGCLNSELTAERNKNRKKYNEYDLSGEYGIGYTSKGEEFYFDLEDYDKIKDYCWYINSRGYVIRPLNGKSGSRFFHRMIIDCPDGFEIDHIHQDKKYDNRKSNLRVCTHMENSMNRKIRPDNTSGVTGVYWVKKQHKWLSMIVANGRTQKKRFKNFEDAVAQRKKWEREFFKEFSYDNSQNVKVV